MLKITSSMFHIRQMDDLARQDSGIHRLHPLVKLITTLVFLIIVMSFPSHRIAALMPYFLYPVLLLSLANLPVRTLLYRLLLVEPLILGIGLINTLFDPLPVQIGTWQITRGQITLLSILVKSLLTLSASLLLLMTTGIEKLAVALQTLKVPRIFILQLLMTTRYISVLTEELSRMLRAYFLRAPGQRGLNYQVWGVFSGQLLIRTFERANRVYQAMVLRGYVGDFHAGQVSPWRMRDSSFLLCWLVYFLSLRFFF